MDVCVAVDAGHINGVSLVHLDEAVAAIVTRILADEKLHLETFRTELESLCREGGCGKECRGGCGRECGGPEGEKK